MNQESSGHILIVDDEASARVSLAEILRLEGYQVDTAASGEEAIRFLEKAEDPLDLVLLDLKMPGMDGLEVAEELKKQCPSTVIVLLTAFGTLETAIQAMRDGAHDYLLKPCPIPDILDTVREGLRKRQEEQQRQNLVNTLQQTISQLASVEGAEEDSVVKTEEPDPDRFLQSGEFVLDRHKHVAMVRGDQVDLTPTEFKILACLMETPDEVWSPRDLVRNAQGYETDAWGARAIIRVHIRRLRKKVEKTPSDPERIINVRGVGYLFSTGKSLEEQAEID